MTHNTPSTAHSPHPTPAGPVLVVGATGKTGSRVAALLEVRGHDIRRASRSSDIVFDWTDRSTWAPTLAGAGPVYLTYQPDLIAPGATDDIAEFVRLADEAGVPRLVLLAGRGEAEADAAGRLVHAARAESTVLSCAWFDQNFTEGGFAPEIAAGSLTLPVGDVGEPFIDADDIAAVAVAALLEVTADGDNPHAGRTYDCTGPRLLTFAEAAAEFGRARGAVVTFTEVSSADYRDLLRQFDVPAPEVELLLVLFGKLFDGRNAYISDDVERVLGRPPRDIVDVAAAWTRSAAQERVSR
ncbi:NmrA family transcriptional regulator [Gordonia sp. OPL2]|uniref:NmrA family transcriptional regulator n=1 Tax=Gordonia sp. OPL2 TaxID=2486274 RepID=UPI001656126A|nr:NmrA family transcriptional regulator [Gordonia sp. OPL2]ROZ89294.1 NmrA family transcriptional regulator [Gordonia sp. OPL2]